MRPAGFIFQDFLNGGGFLETLYFDMAEPFLQRRIGGIPVLAAGFVEQQVLSPLVIYMSDSEPGSAAFTHLGERLEFHFRKRTAHRLHMEIDDVLVFRIQLDSLQPDAERSFLGGIAFRRAGVGVEGVEVLGLHHLSVRVDFRKRDRLLLGLALIAGEGRRK